MGASLYFLGLAVWHWRWLGLCLLGTAICIEAAVLVGLLISLMPRQIRRKHKEGDREPY